MTAQEEIANKTTIPKLVKRVKEENPTCPVSEYGIRAAIRNGEIVAPRIGNKYVITPEQVLSYYSPKENKGSIQ